VYRRAALVGDDRESRHIFNNQNLLRKMSNLEVPVSEFSLVGQLLEFFSNDLQQIEAISVATGDRQWQIKLSKKLQLTIGTSLQLGSWLEIQGTSRKQPVTGAIKLKAKSLKKTTIDGLLTKPTFDAIDREIKEEKASILVCGHSKCWKRGGRAICQLLEENIRNRGLQERVTIETTDCLKKCKYAPNLIMMPDKTRYSEVTLHEIPLLLDKHL
jgi:NADH:ubiquinone oxidoreductase subunit E